jgi:hypothetical protein
VAPLGLAAAVGIQDGAQRGDGIVVRAVVDISCLRNCASRHALVKHAGIPQSRRNIMGKIALEEHMVLDREDHLDRWRTLVPMIPEQFLQRILPPCVP